MSGRSEVEAFFRTLILGDFEANQNTAAQIVGGLASMIPVLDQVLDVRDIAGSLYLINQRGGFKGATTDDIVNLAFAAFGAIPVVGSAFKTVFKPLYRHRKAAQGAVQGGLQAMERMLGMKKGGALTWIRKELLDKWPARTQEAVAKAEAALESVIALTHFLATASGWKDYLVPDSIQSMAASALQGLQQLRGGIRTPLERGSREIHELLKDLIGEQAAAVVLAVGMPAAPASARAGTRTKGGHNAAAQKPKGSVPARQAQDKTGGTPSTAKKQGGGPVDNQVLNTAQSVADLANDALGVSGEHIADYICADKFGWAPGWQQHDDGHTGGWKVKPSAEQPGKLSSGGKPKVRHALYKLTDGANGTGIDAVWHTTGKNGGKKYAIVEAKASRDEDGPKFMRKPGNTRKPAMQGKLGVSGAVDLLEPLDDGAGAKPQTGKAGGGKPGGAKPSGAGTLTTKPKVTAPAGASAGKASPTQLKGHQAGGPMVQMSHVWILANLESAVGHLSLADSIRENGYARHLFFSPLYHPSAAAHAEAIVKRSDESEHRKHDAIHYDESEVKRAVNKRKAALRRRHGNHPNLVDEV